MPKATIALVDDDRNILTSVALALEAEGFEIRSYSDSELALRDIVARPVDLAVLDVKMPRLDGFELLTRLRKTSALPVIFLTSKDTDSDEIRGFDAGADDYIRKPFSQALLIARIRALLRRRDSERDMEVVVRGQMTLDPARHEVTWKGKAVDLTVTEFLIVTALAQRPGHVKSRDNLLDAAYGEDGGYVDDRTIDSHIKRIRKKFKVVDAEFEAIETLYGVGYKYAAE